MRITVNVTISEVIEKYTFVLIGYKSDAVKHISCLNEYSLLTRL